jgi:isopentenyldiphosphate isomerase
MFDERGLTKPASWINAVCIHPLICILYRFSFKVEARARRGGNITGAVL